MTSCRAEHRKKEPCLWSICKFFLSILSNFKTVETFILNCPLLVARETFLNITDCKEPKSKMLEFVRFTGYIDEEKIHDGMQPVFVSMKKYA